MNLPLHADGYDAATALEKPMPQIQIDAQIPQLRAELAQILHHANTGLITRDGGDHTHYEAMAIAAIDHFLGLSLIGTAEAAKRTIADLLLADNEPNNVIPLRPRRERDADRQPGA